MRKCWSGAGCEQWLRNQGVFLQSIWGINGITFGSHCSTFSWRNSLETTTLPIEKAQEHPPLIFPQNLAICDNAALRYCSSFWEDCLPFVLQLNVSLLECAAWKCSEQGFCQCFWNSSCLTAQAGTWGLAYFFLLRKENNLKKKNLTLRLVLADFHVFGFLHSRAQRLPLAVSKHAIPNSTVPKKPVSFICPAIKHCFSPVSLLLMCRYWAIFTSYVFSQPWQKPFFFSLRAVASRWAVGWHGLLWHFRKELSFPFNGHLLERAKLFHWIFFSFFFFFT